MALDKHRKRPFSICWSDHRNWRLRSKFVEEQHRMSVARLSQRHALLPRDLEWIDAAEAECDRQSFGVDGIVKEAPDGDGSSIRAP
jgi:hypothetical protein